MTVIAEQPQVYCPSLHLLSEEELERLSIFRLHDKSKKYRYSHSNELVSIRSFLQEDEAWMVLYFIGEHVSVRYSQLLFFMKKRLNRQAMSRILKTLDYYQIIQKWRIQIRQDEESEEAASYKESAFTITEYGYQLLKYWCGQKYFYHPKNFEKHGKYVHLRYWQDIDMLCHLRNQPRYQDHIMHAKLTHGLLPSSFSFRVKQKKNNEINFIVYSVIERVLNPS
ncbi:hypothetical protein ACFQZ1_09825 [Bacillus sp. CGMCC 1.60114]|uniref:hypothetical protein n=1 Tax=unclassified Bacillus (in: firmicutes) TaxID=185979 RepID=UPI0036404E16